MKPVVLVVDDNADSREVTRVVLSDAGYECLEARDGIEAVELTRSRGPAVVLMDVFMPHMDGITAAHQLRNDPQAPHPPIVVLTAHPTFLEAVSELFFAILRKPCAPPQLLATIARACTLAPSPQPAPP